MDRLLYYVFAGSRGGATRVRIIQAIRNTPLNTHQIAKALDMDYKTIQYNLRVLAKHTYVVTATEGYGKLWEPSKNLKAAWDAFDAIREKLKLGKQPNNEPGE